MKRAALILAALAAILTAAAAPVRTATENFVTNKIAEANAALVATTHSAISSFASTGTVKKAKSANTATEATRATTATTADFAYNLYSLPDWTSWTVASLLNAATNAANHAVDVFSDNLAAVATSGKYSDLSGKPTNVSDFSNDAGYLTGYTETDPTVPQWAKTPTKPTYTASEVGATTPEDVTAAIREQSLGGIWDSQLEVWWTPIMQNGALRYETNAVQNAADTLAVVSNVVASGGLASVDAVDAKISTNNAAFVEAVLAVPIAGADASDTAELAEYGSYGTAGAALLALIAGLAALKRRMGTAETALAQKANAADLPYALVTPGEWTFSGSGYDPTAAYSVIETPGYDYTAYQLKENGDIVDSVYDGITDALSVNFDSEGITATRASLPGHLLDRANNLIDATTGNVTLTLPPFVAGKVRDLLVACTIGLDTNDEPWSVIFQGQGSEAPSGADEISFKAEGDDAASATFPVPNAAGDWWYSFTERAPHVFAVSLKQLQSVSQPTQGGS